MRPLACHCGMTLDWDTYLRVRGAAARADTVRRERMWRRGEDPDATRRDEARLPALAGFAAARVPPSRPCCRSTLLTSVDRTLEHAIAQRHADVSSITRLCRAPRGVAHVTVPYSPEGRGHPCEHPLPRAHPPHAYMTALQAANAAWIDTVAAASAPHTPEDQQGGH